MLMHIQGGTVMDVRRTIDGYQVVVSPVFNGGAEPEYWEVSIDDHLFGQTFARPDKAVRFAEQYIRAQSPGSLQTSGLLRSRIEV
jgi:hypothetical protein